MKEYLVTTKKVYETCYPNVFIVSAKEAKEAINKVFEKHFEQRNESLKRENDELGYYANHIYSKSDLQARSIGSLHNEQGSVIVVN